jgi:hypothetical protein
MRQVTEAVYFTARIIVPEAAASRMLRRKSKRRLPLFLLGNCPVTFLHDLPFASGNYHGLFTVQNPGNLEQFCCNNQRERQQNKLFLGKTIVVNSTNSVSVITSSRLMRAKRLGRGFRTHGEKERRQN